MHIYLCHMHRTTILLPPDLQREAQGEARRLGISLGELIRRRLRQPSSSDRQEKPRFFHRRPWADSGPTDTAAHHDRYLYDS